MTFLALSDEDYIHRSCSSSSSLAQYTMIRNIYSMCDTYLSPHLHFHIYMYARAGTSQIVLYRLLDTHPNMKHSSLTPPSFSVKPSQMGSAVASEPAYLGASTIVIGSVAGQHARYRRRPRWKTGYRQRRSIAIIHCASTLLYSTFVQQSGPYISRHPSFPPRLPLLCITASYHVPQPNISCTESADKYMYPLCYYSLLYTWFVFRPNQLSKEDSAVTLSAEG